MGKCKNCCRYACIVQCICEQLSYTTQRRTVLIIFPINFLMNIIVQMLSLGADKVSYFNMTRSIWKMLGPFTTASRLTPIHQMSLAVLRIDVHDNDDNDNAWQRGPLWPHGMGAITSDSLKSCEGSKTMVRLHRWAAKVNNAVGVSEQLA